MKIVPVEAQLLHANGRTDRHTTKLIAAFRNLAKASTNLSLIKPFAFNPMLLWFVEILLYSLASPQFYCKTVIKKYVYVQDLFVCLTLNAQR